MPDFIVIDQTTAEIHAICDGHLSSGICYVHVSL